MFSIQIDTKYLELLLITFSFCFFRSTFREMCHKTPNPMKNAAKRLLKSLSPLVFKTFYTLSWSTVQGEIFLTFYSKD